jgi:hypothetical protein
MGEKCIIEANMLTPQEQNDLSTAIEFTVGENLKFLYVNSAKKQGDLLKNCIIGITNFRVFKVNSKKRRFTMRDEIIFARQVKRVFSKASLVCFLKDSSEVSYEFVSEDACKYFYDYINSEKQQYSANELKSQKSLIELDLKQKYDKMKSELKQMYEKMESELKQRFEKMGSELEEKYSNKARILKSENDEHLLFVEGELIKKFEMTESLRQIELENTKKLVIEQYKEKISTLMKQVVNVFADEIDNQWKNQN